MFSSYGSICWLSDLHRWAAGICTVLAPGGRFVTIDFHPMSMMLDREFALAYPYFAEDTPQKWDDGICDYVAASGTALAPSGFVEGVRDFKNPHIAYEFQWHIGAILTALLEAGLSLEQFHEYPYSNGAQLFEDMHEQPGRRMFPPEHLPTLPLMFSLSAMKPDRS